MIQSKKRLHNRKLVSFLQATDNEIAIDLLNYKILKINPSDLAHVPRPFKVIQVFKKINLPIRKFLIICPFIWISCFAFLFNTYFLIYSLISVFFSKNLINQLSFVNTFYIAFSQRAIEIIPFDEGNQPQTWIIFPWIREKNFPLHHQFISIYSLLKYKDVLTTYYLSFAVIKLLYKRNNHKFSSVLQSYTAFNWFLARVALEKLNGNYVFSEHYDRWAVLIDSLVYEKRNSTGNLSNNNYKLTLFQHGIIGIPSNIIVETDYHLQLKYKLECVSNLFIYDNESKNLFFDFVLSKNCINRLIEINYKKPTIILTDIDNQNSLTILFIGHPACEELHINILKKLKVKIDFQAFYKPHPLSKYSQSVREQEWVIINDPNFYPKVDHIISYPSTLIVEYSNFNISASAHSFDLSSKSQTEFITSIINEITKKRI